MRVRRAALFTVVWTFLFIVTTLAMPQSALACDIIVMPSASTGRVGDVLTVEVQVSQTHRNCTVPIEATAIRTSGLTLVSSTPWLAVAPQTWAQTLKVQLGQPGIGTIAVVRECPRGGDAVQVSVTIDAAEDAGKSDSNDSAENTPNLPVASPDAQSDGEVPSLEDQANGELRGEADTKLPVRPVVAAADMPANPDVPVSSRPASDDSTATVFPDASEVLDSAVGSGASLEVQAQGAGGPEPGINEVLAALESAFAEPRLRLLLILLAVAVVGYLRGVRLLRIATLLVALGLLGFAAGGILCPFSVLQTMVAEIGRAGLHPLPYLMLGFVVLTTALFGRIYCGWICPAGALQEVVHRQQVRVRVPERLDRWLKLVKYVALVALVVAVLAAGSPLLRDLEPFRVAWDRGGNPVAVGLFTIVIVGSVLIQRLWCRYLCPMGALLGLLSRLSPLSNRIGPSCVRCRACVGACPTQAIRVSAGELSIDRAECISCDECRHTCRKDAIVRRQLAGLGTTGTAEALPAAVLGRR